MCLISLKSIIHNLEKTLMWAVFDSLTKWLLFDLEFGNTAFDFFKKIRLPYIVFTWISQTHYYTD